MNTVTHVPHFWQLCTYARKTGEPVARETKGQNLEPFKGWNRMARLELMVIIRLKGAIFIELCSDMKINQIDLYFAIL